MKKVYIVTGSEDGIVGVFSSKSKARHCAANYVLADYPIQALDSTVLSDATKWNEYFYSTNTNVTAEIIIEELQ